MGHRPIMPPKVSKPTSVVPTPSHSNDNTIVDRHYVDPTVLPTPAAFQLWGWVLSRQYVACHPVPSRERLVLPDPREMPAAE